MENSESERNGEAQDSPDDEGDDVLVKEEPQREVEMKDYAEDTMNELLGMYGYDRVEKSVTENLQLQHFDPDGQENEGADDAEESTAESPDHVEDTEMHKDEESPQKIKNPQPSDSTDIKPSEDRTNSLYKLRERKPSASYSPEVLVNGKDTTLMNQYKSATKPKKRSHSNSSKTTTPVVKRPKHHSSSSESEGSMCSCGTCGGSDHEQDNKPSRRLNILSEIKKILEENKALRKENKKLEEELRESFNVRQLAQDLRHLSNSLQKNSGSSPVMSMSRPASTGSVSSSSALLLNGGGKKLPSKMPKIKVEETFVSQPDGDEFEDSEQEELCSDSGILLPSARIQNALQNAQANYRLFTRSLMEMVFTKETMATSSARGQKSQGKTTPDNPRPPLDQSAVKAIVARVTHEFPEIHPTLVMGVIRQKIADVRKRLKIQTNRELTLAAQESLSMV